MVGRLHESQKTKKQHEAATYVLITCGTKGSKLRKGKRQQREARQQHPEWFFRYSVDSHCSGSQTTTKYSRLSSREQGAGNDSMIRTGEREVTECAKTSKVFRIPP